MASTSIEWTNFSWNPIVGCSVLSPGCTNCYAMAMAARLDRMGQPRYVGLTKSSKAGPVWTGEMRFVVDVLTAPLKRRKPTKYFVNSMSDLFHADVPDEWIDRIFAVMALAPQHTFQVLTKRADRMRAYLTAKDLRIRVQDVVDNMEPNGIHKFPGYEPWIANDFPLRNCWLGVSVEDQCRADERRQPMTMLAGAGWRTFVSYEPALARVDWTGWEFLAWLISGGESGPGARPSHPDSHRRARDFCAEHGIKYFFKQWGEYHTAASLMTTGEPVFRQFIDFQHWVNKASTWVNGGVCLDAGGRLLRNGADFMRARDEGAFPVTIMHRVGKKAAGRLLDGVTHDAFPSL